MKLAEVSVSVDLFLQCLLQVAAESSLSLRLATETCTQNINSIYF